MPVAFGKDAKTESKLNSLQNIILKYYDYDALCWYWHYGI